MSVWRRAMGFVQPEAVTAIKQRSSRSSSVSRRKLQKARCSRADGQPRETALFYMVGVRQFESQALDHSSQHKCPCGTAHPQQPKFAESSRADDGHANG